SCRHRPAGRRVRPARYRAPDPRRRRAIGALPRSADLGDAAAGLAGLSVRRHQDGVADPDLRTVDRRADQLRRDHVLRAHCAHRRGGLGPERTWRMSAHAIGACGVGVLFALLLLRVPVWISLVLVGFFGNVLVNGWAAAFALAGTTPFDVASSYTLSVVPLFILMGEVASESRLSGELFNAARVILSGFRGGLAVATLAASALFSAVSGSSLANSATMTRMALPELRKAGYDDGLSTGCIAAGGSTDILIPPSIILVIYAAIAELSVPKLLAAGLIPGLVLTFLYIAVAMAVVRVRPDYAPHEQRYPWRERIAALREPWQFLALFIVTIGGIYAGVFSPTEAASVGAFGAILLGLLGRRLSLREVVVAIESTVV